MIGAVFERLSAALSDRYRLEREIGAGGMATVYLAEDLRHRRRVALKVLRPELTEVLGAERFLKEIEVTAQPSTPAHPPALRLRCGARRASTRRRSRLLLYYVMPYVEGESLRARLDREKQLPARHARSSSRDRSRARSTTRIAKAWSTVTSSRRTS